VRLGALAEIVLKAPVLASNKPRSRVLIAAAGAILIDAVAHFGRCLGRDVRALAAAYGAVRIKSASVLPPGDERQRFAGSTASNGSQGF